MTRKILASVFVVAVLTLSLASSCDEVTNVQTSVRVVLTVESVTSGILEPGMPGDTLFGDSVRFIASKIQGGDSTDVSGRFSSSDPAFVRVNPTTGHGRLIGLGNATVSVKLDEPIGSDSVFSFLVVPVDSFVVTISATSPTLAASGDTLVGDTVTFSASVSKARAPGGGPIPTQGQSFASTNTNVVRFLDAPAGLAVLEGTGSSSVGVTFTSPQVPSGNLTAGGFSVPVSDFSLSVSIESRSGFNGTGADTLVTDTLVYHPSVTKDGLPVTLVNPRFSSGNPSVLSQINDSTFELTSSGSTFVLFEFDAPTLPQMRDSLPIRVGDFILGVSGPSAPVMGDSPVYTSTIIDTRTGGAPGSITRNFSSTNTTVLTMTTGGSGFARDLGNAFAKVVYTQPTLPFGTLTDSLAVSITQERFYGGMAVDSSGDFKDRRRLLSSPVHEFNSNTTVRFAGGAMAIVDSVVGTNTLFFTVPAGAGTGAFTLHNVTKIGVGDRDGLQSHYSFGGGTNLSDDFEPNDMFPLSAAVRIGALPFDTLLAIDHTKSSPADSNFFWFVLGIGQSISFTAKWQDSVNIDFRVCQSAGNPPSGYFPDDINPNCPDSATSSAFFSDSIRVALTADTFAIPFYCVGCPGRPVTYRVRINP